MVDGYEVLKAMELCGTSSGDLIFDVVIIRCGLGHGQDHLTISFVLMHL